MKSILFGVLTFLILMFFFWYGGMNFFVRGFDAAYATFLCLVVSLFVGKLSDL